jgi:hypothetical protein
MTPPTVRATAIRGVFPFIGCDSGLPLAQSMTSDGTGQRRTGTGTAPKTT